MVHQGPHGHCMSDLMPLCLSWQRAARPVGQHAVKPRMLHTGNALRAQSSLLKGTVDRRDSRCNYFIHRRAVCYDGKVEGDRQRPWPRLAQALHEHA